MAESTPKAMRALVVPSGRFNYPNNPPTPNDLILDSSFPVSVPTPSQYLIRVRSVGISRYELTWEGTSSNGQPRIPAFDVAGTVVSSPPNAKFKKGEAVFGLLPWDGQGGLADFVVAEEKYLARIPEWRDPLNQNRRFETAAVLPRAALTAYQALKVLKGGVLKNGSTVLINGASGAVGRIGVQIASDGVGESGKIIAVAGRRDADLVERELEGPNVTVLRPSSWVDEAQRISSGFDVVFDIVGGEFLEKSLELTKVGGVVFTVATPIVVVDDIKGIGEARKRGVDVEFFIVEEHGDQLEKVAELVQKGVIKPAIGEIVDGFTEEGVRDAWSSWRGNGGIVVNVSKPEED